LLIVNAYIGHQHPPTSSKFKSVEYPLDAILDCLAPEGRSTYAAQYVADEVMALGQPSPDFFMAWEQPLASCLNFPQCHLVAKPPSVQQLLVEYNIPMDKANAHPHEVPYFPQGSIMDPGILICPSSPTTPFEFPFDLIHHKHAPPLGDVVQKSTSMDSATRLVGLPCVFGLKGDDSSYVRVIRSAVAMVVIDNLSLMDGGAKIMPSQ
jgi:hypothetical protein